MSDKKAVRVIISGRVQGVFFRKRTEETADLHQVTGWVRNRRDGKVEAFFEGDADKVDRVLEWCRKGPSMAEVAGLEISDESYAHKYDDFSIRYT